ncbi:pyrroline-5-carboxylate reductase [Texcoconibacillus texcoconensis]|uniref:Pyrroline-5-carboxylate reductase n=1 Tax=Texcoconibacillus texcoconensis TaxID=1095777 RepID=A0A840QSE6_9BACI|nr:pyrroline-5-carboxylate reductase [Texcoconibacillus texcoconensis]MBB5174432.1 pyrroline-5-carboxylate reductase [Texcoconibacillus texcoconensis]
MLNTQKIAFIGAGSMAEAIIGGLITEQLIDPKQVIATNNANEKRLQELEEKYGIQTTANNETAIQNADIVVLAMKPKHLTEAAEQINAFISDQLIISVLAGISTSYIEESIGKSISVIRAMPNTSAKVGASATSLCKGRFAYDEHIQKASSLFSAIGTVTILSEEKMDAVTGVAGSGPAFFYYFVEAIENAALEAGLTENETKELIAQTLTGAARRLRNTDKSARELYMEVMSPAGTTEAAFEVLENHNVKEHVKNSVLRAIERSQELGATPAPFTSVNKQ